MLTSIQTGAWAGLMSFTKPARNLSAGRGGLYHGKLLGDKLADMPVRGGMSLRATQNNGAEHASPVDTQILELMQAVAGGAMNPEEAAKKMMASNGAGVREVGDMAKVDSGRVYRTGEPEVILGTGKTPEQLAAIMNALANDVAQVLVTRVRPVVAHATMDLLKAQGVDGRRMNYNEAPNYQSQVLKLDGPGKQRMARLPGVVTIVTGGVGDTPVLDECMEVGSAMGMYMAPIRDISVDGLQRAMGHVEALK